MKNVLLEKVYRLLLSAYGPQGWWPLLELHSNGINPTKTGSMRGYHPGDYCYPKTASQCFEICCGAILTQNTAWPSVEKALTNLNDLKVLSPKGILTTDIDIIKEAIRPAGYFNQKAQYLRNFTEFFMSLSNSTPSRQQVLDVKGVGEETADSIMLYAFRRPTFVIDAYTRRIMSRIGIIRKDMKYSGIQEVFHRAIPEKDKNIPVYQEYHALLVEHAKRHCNTRPVCVDCPLYADCQKIL